MIIGLKWHLHYKIIVINYFLFFLICFFKPFIRAVICSQNDGEDGAHILHISLALTCAYPPSYQDPPPEWCIFMTDEPTVTHCYHSKSIVYFVVDFPCCTCYEFGQHMTITSHCDETIGTLLSLFIPPHPLNMTTSNLLLSPVLSFPECYIVGITQYVTFSD